MIYVVLRLIFHQFNPYFRRDAEDSAWIRILTMLGLSAELYNDLTQENINNNCPSKLICQAFESRDFLGFTSLTCLAAWSSSRAFILGFEDSYIRKAYQLFTSLQFKTGVAAGGGGLNDNKLTVRISLSTLLFVLPLYFLGRKFYMFLQVSRVWDVPDLIITKASGGKKQLLEE